MIHPSCLFFTLLFLWGWRCQSSAPHRPGLALACLAAFSLGSTRVVELLMPGLIAFLWPPRKRSAWAWLALSIGLALALLAWTNQRQNGSLFMMGFNLYDPEDRWGFGTRGHDFPRAVWNQSYSLLRYLAWMPAGWLVLLLAGLPASSTPLRGLLVASLASGLFYACYFNLGQVEYGPRYWFIPGLLMCLLSGEGALFLCHKLQSRYPGPNWLGGLIAILITQAFVQHLQIGFECYRQIEPFRIQFEQVQTALSQGPPTLVLLQSGGGERARDWVRFNSPEMNEWVTYAYFLEPPSNQKLAEAFPNRAPVIFIQDTDASGQLAGGLQPYEPPANDSEAASQWARAGENYLSASELQNQDAAARCFEKVLELEPSNPYAHAYLAQIEGNKGRFDKAIEHGRMVVAEAPDNAKARYQLALDLERSGRTTEARGEMETIAKSGWPEAGLARQWMERHGPP